jgi:hypothetical protein
MILSTKKHFRRRHYIATTLTSYGTIDPHRQGEVIASISLAPDVPKTDLIAIIRELVR